MRKSFYLKYLFYILFFSFLATSCTTTKGLSSIPKDEPKDLAINLKSLEKVKAIKIAKNKKEQKKQIALFKKQIKKDSLKFISEIRQHDSLHLAFEKNMQREHIIESAEEFLGTKYYFGGMTKNGIDCSALIFNAYSDNLIDVPRTSLAQSKLGKRIKKEKAKPGDLIFFKTTSKSRITHVGIVTENKDGEIKFIHASSSHGVMISSLEETYFHDAFATIKQLL